jgi:hypothetical protein
MEGVFSVLISVLEGEFSVIAVVAEETFFSCCSALEGEFSIFAEVEVVWGEGVEFESSILVEFVRGGPCDKGEEL